MKRINNLVLMAILLSVLTLWGCSDHATVVGPVDNNINYDNFEAQESLLFNVEVKDQTQLRLEGINGDVFVSGVAGANAISIKCVKKVYSESYADAKAQLSHLDVKVDDLTDKVFVKSMFPKNSKGRNYLIDYSISMPQNMRVWINNINGEIQFNNMHASVLANQSNGDIIGEISLPLNGSIDMTTMNGSIKLDVPKNSSAEFSANVSIGKIKLSNLNLQNKSESAKSLQGRFGDGQGSIIVTTTNGNISVKGF